MALRRGFKSEAERIASEVQAELGLSSSQSVAPEALAELLDVEIRAGDDLIPLTKFEELGDVQGDAFSACTLQPSPERVVIVFNPLSEPPRRRSDLAHELAHILLDHEFSRVEKLGNVTFLSGDVNQEDEAAWLSGCLLLPRALLSVEVRKGAGAKEIAKKYRVSENMARFRLNVTGVLRQNRAFLKNKRLPQRKVSAQ